MKLSLGDNEAAVADPQVKVGVEKGIAVISGLREENADMVEATLSLVTSRRLSAAIRRPSGSSVQVDFEINMPAGVEASIDAYDVADSLASADEDSLKSALSKAIASVAVAGYSVEIAELPSVAPVVAPAPVPAPTSVSAPATVPEPASETQSSPSLMKVAAVVIAVIVLGFGLGCAMARARKHGLKGLIRADDLIS